MFFSKQMATLSDVHQKELESLSMLRTSNESKFQSSPSSVAPTVCLCHTVPAGPMLQCELCRDAYHSGCVPGFKDIQTGLPWLCPLCKRSEKPPLDKVLPLLASLQRIRVRLPEGDALRYVIERTVRWQHKVQQVLPIQHPNGKVSIIFNNNSLKINENDAFVFIFMFHSICDAGKKHFWNRIISDTGREQQFFLHASAVYSSQW